MANTTSRRGKGPAPTGKTPQTAMRLSADTLEEIDALRDALALESRTAAVVYAVRKLYVSTGLAKGGKK